MTEDYPTICPRCGSPVGSVKACFDLLAGVNAREYSDREYAAVLHLTVDAHALQHPEDHSLKSNNFHLARLCWVLKFDGSAAIGSGPPWLEASFDDLPEIPLLEPPAPLQRGELTIANIHPAVPPDEHERQVRAWGESVWEGWSEHHTWAFAWINAHKSE